MVEGARLESEYTAKPYRGFESLPLRHSRKSNVWSRHASGIVPIVTAARIPILPSMNTDQGKAPSPAFTDTEEEIRKSRKFSPQEAMARMAGPGAMKGASPVSPQQQAEIELGTWIRANVIDPAGALHAVLHRHVRGSEEVLGNLDRPLAGLADMCRQLLESDYRMKELVRETDAEWGERMDERPYFDRDGSPALPGDPYTIAWVTESLRGIVANICDPS